MSNNLTVEISGFSNEIYHFEIWSIESEFENVEGVYIFSKIDISLGSSEPIQRVHLYIGETRSFKERLPEHEKLSDAIDCGMDMILFLREKDEDCRKKIESELIQKYKPIVLPSEIRATL